MASVFQFIQSLRRYGAESSSKTQELKNWRDEVIADIRAGNSGQIINGSVNNTTFAQSAGMTNIELLTALDDALLYISIGATPSTRTMGRCC